MSLAGIDTNLVVALHALLEEKNVTRAARRLGLGQSATSHALARLRQHFGDPLLVRVGRSLDLTDRARSLRGPTTRAIAELEQVFEPARPFDPRAARRVFRVAATDNLELYVLPRLTAILAREAPLVDVRFHHLPKEWQTELSRGDLELKLGRKSSHPVSLRSEDLCKDRMVCVVRRGSSVGRRLTLAKYASLSHILVAPGETARSPMDDVLARAGLRRRIAITVPHFLVALYAVASSDHVLTIPERLVEAASFGQRLRVVPLPLQPAEYTLSQVWAARHDADEGHAWLRAAVRRAIG